jgi:PPOX class probable F420-dependent enzyme
MLKLIPASHRDLLSDEVRAFAYLATQMADLSPQVTPVWFNVDGEHILVNTARGRAKERNMSQRPQVALAISDPADPYRYIQIRGRVEQVVEEGAREHIDALSKKYTGRERYTPRRPDEVRVIYKILPERVTVQG